jgi:tetratricopeptide (TPR) repeat protein
LLGRAGVLIALQRSDDARADLQRCLQREPGSYEALVSMGGIEIAHDRIDAAREWLDRALAVNPAGVDALIDRAFCEDATGQWQLAMRDNRAAIASDPTRYEGYANVAYDLLEAHLPSPAESTLRDGLRADPSNGRLHFLLARTYELEKRPAASVRAEYTAALASDEEVIVRAANDALHVLATKHD